jgi:flagellar protein FliS
VILGISSIRPSTGPICQERRAAARADEFMQQSMHNEYLKNAVMTASPEQLQLMLYDGSIRFARQARDAMGRRDFDESCEKLIRAQRIVVEMQQGLRHEVNPELCAQLNALYQFVYERLVEANMRQDVIALDDALRILDHQRETWRLLIARLSGTGPDGGAAPAEKPAASAGAAHTAGSLSIQG